MKMKNWKAAVSLMWLRWSSTTRRCLFREFCCVLRQAFDLIFSISIDSKKNETERETKSMCGYRGSLFCRSGVVIFQKGEVIP
ncbi:hypothetical protein T02_9492 [Trichinella nativa]|uniref:Secreted protein n=1 Tax=Trichinella nativa TaxID=6335 RepID=A0A0V1KXT3_9BILA|nr:hypothetical protein T02_9492 [Trichinella nativa]